MIVRERFVTMAMLKVVAMVMAIVASATCTSQTDEHQVTVTQMYQNQRQELEDVKRELAWVKGVLASQSNITKHIVGTLQQNCGKCDDCASIKDLDNLKAEVTNISALVMSNDIKIKVAYIVRPGGGTAFSIRSLSDNRRSASINIQDPAQPATDAAKTIAYRPGSPTAVYYFNMAKILPGVSACTLMYTEDDRPVDIIYYFGADAGNSVLHIFPDRDFTFWIGIHGHQQYTFPEYWEAYIVCLDL